MLNEQVYTDATKDTLQWIQISKTSFVSYLLMRGGTVSGTLKLREAFLQHFLKHGSVCSVCRVQQAADSSKKKLKKGSVFAVGMNTFSE